MRKDRPLPWLLPFTAGAILLLFSSLSYSETIIGRWCDRVEPTRPQYNRVLTIVITDGSKAELRYRGVDGSLSVEEIQEIYPSIYWLKNPELSERYRIGTIHSNLLLFNQHGPIRTALRPENSARPRERGR